MNTAPIKSRDLILDLQQGVEETKQPYNDNPTVIVRIGGKDHVAMNITTAYDGVIGHHIIIEAESLAKFL